MRRRQTLSWLPALCAAPLPALAQPAGKVHRIAWLSSTSYADTPMWPDFVQAMRERGWVEGRNYQVAHLLYEGRNERLQSLAAEAVQRGVDLIVCAGTAPTAAAKAATTTIPIVFFFVGDPVGAGFAATLARSEGNLTGLGGLGPGIYAKTLGLLKEMVPKAARVAVFANPALQPHAVFADDATPAAQRLKVALSMVELRSPDGIDAAFATLARDKVDALLILGQPFLLAHSTRVAKLAVESRLPAVVPFAEVARVGVLMSYGARLADDVRRLPYYIDRILRGAKPADLPVEQPSRFYLTINLKTAKAIGLPVPAALRQRADELIE